MKRLAVVFLWTFLCAGFAEFPEISSRKITNSNPKAPSTQSNYNSPPGSANLPNVGCGLSYGSYPLYQESQSVPKEELKDQPDKVNAAEGTRRLEKYESELRAWCEGIERGFTPADVARKVESSWQAAGGQGPVPAEVLKYWETSFYPFLLSKLEGYVRFHIAILRLRTLTVAQIGDLRGYAMSIDDPLRAAWFIGCGPVGSGIGNGICPASRAIFKVESLDAIAKGLKNLPPASTISAYFDKVILQNVTCDVELADPNRTKSYNEIFTACRQQQDDAFYDKFSPIPNQLLFPPPAYEILAEGGKIFLYAKTALGYQSIEDLYVGVPTIVEVQFDTANTAQDVTAEISVSGQKLTLKAHRYDKMGYIFRTDAFLPTEQNEDQGQTWNPKPPPKGNAP